jgi:hypothetical protein
MSSILIPVKTYLGKYYPELYISSSQEKYKSAGVDTFFEQRFLVQNNNIQMVVDDKLDGLQFVFAGNEIYVSQELYNHPHVNVINSMEEDQDKNPRHLYNPDVFSTVAYLMCRNHVTFHIVGKLDKPIYAKYKSEFETFYSTVVVFNIDTFEEIEIVEEIESSCALNAVMNYILNPGSHTKLTTFYRNNISAVSFLYRNVISQSKSYFNHTLLGKGSSAIVDETKITTSLRSNIELFGCVDSLGKNFHSILTVEPSAWDYRIVVDYRNLVRQGDHVSYYPLMIGQEPNRRSSISVNDLDVDTLLPGSKSGNIDKFINDVILQVKTNKLSDTDRLYSNKTKFLNFE